MSGIGSTLSRMLLHTWWRHKGYSWEAAQKWLKDLKNDRSLENGISLQDKKALHKAGYLSYRMLHNGFDAKTAGDVSDREYAYIYPLNSAYFKWINDRITYRYILQNQISCVARLYYQFIERDHQVITIRLFDLPSEYGISDDEVLRFLREKKELLFAPSSEKGGAFFRLSFDHEAYAIDGETVPGEKVLELLKGQTNFYQLMSYPKQSRALSQTDSKQLNTLYVSVINEHGEDPFVADAYVRWRGMENGAYSPVCLETGAYQAAYDELGVQVRDDAHGNAFEGSVPAWEAVKETARQIALHMRELEAFQIELAVEDDAHVVLGLYSMPLKKAEGPHSEQVQAYFRRRIDHKNSLERPALFKLQYFNMLKKRILRHIFCDDGFMPFWANEWVESMFYDLFHYHGLSLRDKIWSYRRGFISYHKVQYNLTEENWREYISDYHYKWLYPINCSYFKWIDDKASYRYVMDSCKEYLPEYYFHLVKRQGKLCIIPMHDCPSDIPGTMDGILALLRQKGSMALKQSSGSHGDGFFKLSYSDNRYYINNEEATEETLTNLLSNLSCFYVLTNFLQMHDELKKIYSETVNTIRVMAINRNGHDPQIMNAYMRIGAKATGLTDNIGYGGLFCKIDLNTGRYYDAEQSRDHVIVSCPKHPDTGYLIEGYVPMWAEVQEAVKRMCLAIPQLEYLGFDVAVTNDGVKILEVNKHQDLHRCNLYGPEIQAFYKEKLKQKRSRVRQTRYNQ